MASDELLKRLDDRFDRLEQRMDRAEERNLRFHGELMTRMERWSLAVEARMIELSERIVDQGDLLRAQTQALQRVLDRLPPSTS